MGKYVIFDLTIFLQSGMFYSIVVAYFILILATKERLKIILQKYNAALVIFILFHIFFQKFLEGPNEINIMTNQERQTMHAL